MLDSSNASRTVRQPSSELKCEIQLPPSWDRDRQRRGRLPTCENDLRRFPRFHYHVRAIMECQGGFPNYSRLQQSFVVCTANISRGGLAFLHSEELFPGEHVRIWLPGGLETELEVIRCRHLQERCFELGARFLVPLEAKAVSALLTHDRP